MQINDVYDVAVIGGGLAGLACSILLAKEGHSVVLLEKERYPFHKVCGEYVSLESWDFLKRLGLPLDELNLPLIDTLVLTAPSGKIFTTKLPLGGFGISRFELDSRLAIIAKENGVTVVEETKIDSIKFDDHFQLQSHSTTVTAKVCCAAYGKRSNLDVKWQREFLRGSNQRLDNYVGVKYHIKTKWDNNVIGLHNFEDGYCGISKIEGDRYCLCYMTKANNLKKSNNDIEQLEQTILSGNPHLKRIFEQSEKCQSFPLTISQINFNRKSQVEDHVLMLGDSAGMITPLCGNGMSIALHTAKLASKALGKFLDDTISRIEMEDNYTREWQAQFARRLQTGRRLQYFFGSKRLSNLFVSGFKTLPFLAIPVIKMTHGKPF
ncbi:MAG TPA: NAD(P)/FAD-dependent oxidoreductase [Flavisolibacter sp.]